MDKDKNIKDILKKNKEKIEVADEAAPYSQVIAPGGGSAITLPNTETDPHTTYGVGPGGDLVKFEHDAKPGSKDNVTELKPYR